jgi:flagellar hook protein FlgE
MYDSLGVPHEVTVLYERSDVDTWTWYAVVDAGEVDDGTGVPLTDGTAYQIASGVANFDTAGDLVDNTQTDVVGWTFYGAAASAPVFAFGRDALGVATEGRVRMISGDSAVSAVFQDGYAPGDLTTMSVDPEGVITGVYSNGQDIILGQVALARFPANEGLDRVGSTLFRETVASGQPAIGVADTGGRGMIIGNALEKSNVDLEDEFVSMITSQRGYQANSRVISTANDTLDELVRIV